MGTYSRDQVLSAGGSINHYLFGFPQVAATGTGTGANAAIAYLQMYSAGDGFEDDTGSTDVPMGLGYTKRSYGVNYNNQAIHFAQIVVTVRA